jgi:hypothetical protein
MRKVTGKQMKTVWRKEEFEVGTSRCDVPGRVQRAESGTLASGEPSVAPLDAAQSSPRDDPAINHQPSTIWTMSAPGNAEKTHGKHPTQKPVALIERCLLAATHPGDLVLDPFLGGGTTAIACLRTNRHCVGIELDLAHARLAQKRVDREFVLLWLRQFKVRVEIFVMCSHRREEVDLFRTPSTINSQPSTPSQIDLDPCGHSMDRINGMADTPQIQTDRIYHETKFVFLSCAHVTEASVIHTTVDVSLQEAWAKTPNGKKRETTHIVRCETEIFRIK